MLEQQVDRQQFFEDITELLNKHKMENALIVYVGYGQVFNTVFNAKENDAAIVLNEISDTIDLFFKQQ